MAMLKFRAPPLPIAGPDYKQDYFAQLIRAIGLYFNQLDSKTPSQWDQVIATTFTGGLFNGDGYGIQFPHVAMSDNTEQYATGNDTPTLVNWSALVSQAGWELAAPGTATAQYAGLYKITYELQLANDDNIIQNAFLWVRVNGVNVNTSTTAYTIPARKSIGNPAYVSAYSEMIISISAGDEVEIYWATDLAATSGGGTGVYLHHEVAQTTPYSRPATPSARASIIFVSALPDPNVSSVYAAGYVGAVTVAIS